MQLSHPSKPRIWQPLGSSLTLWRGCDSGGVLPRHAHEEFQLVLSGTVPYQFQYRSGSAILAPMQLGVIQSGEPHASQSQDLTGQTLRLMFFTPDVLTAVAEQITEGATQPVLPNLAISDAVIVNQFLQMHIKLEATTSRLECESLIFGFLTQLIVRCAENPPNLRNSRQEQAIVTQVRSYLDENYAEDVSLTQLAQLVNRSPEHLVRVFTQTIGLPPHTYQTQVKLPAPRRS